MAVITNDLDSVRIDLPINEAVSLVSSGDYVSIYSGDNTDVVHMTVSGDHNYVSTSSRAATSYFLKDCSNSVFDFFQNRSTAISTLKPDHITNCTIIPAMRTLYFVGDSTINSNNIYNLPDCTVNGTLYSSDSTISIGSDVSLNNIYFYGFDNYFYVYDGHPTLSNVYAICENSCHSISNCFLTGTYTISDNSTVCMYFQNDANKVINALGSAYISLENDNDNSTITCSINNSTASSTIYCSTHTSITGNCHQLVLHCPNGSSPTLTNWKSNYYIVNPSGYGSSVNADTSQIITGNNDTITVRTKLSSNGFTPSQIVTSSQNVVYTHYGTLDVYNRETIIPDNSTITVVGANSTLNLSNSKNCSIDTSNSFCDIFMCGANSNVTLSGFNSSRNLNALYPSVYSGVHITGSPYIVNSPFVSHDVKVEQL